jgi:peptide chain release factor 3
VFEKQRGISVATSVMAFEYKNRHINILDTPGHQDFAEDTFRTLTAVDSAIVVVDVAKGVETQTEKLVKVCRMRKTPIMVFINKLDREGKDGFDLLDEIESKLNLKLCPLSWPVGMGYDFKGIYNIWKHNVQLFDGEEKQTIGKKVYFDSIEDSQLEAIIGDQAMETLKEELELIDGVYPQFDREAYLKGELQPVLFGSALNNFGVEELLKCFIESAPEPLPKFSEERLIEPHEKKIYWFCI